jgi:hypothetical protein
MLLEQCVTNWFPLQRCLNNARRTGPPLNPPGQTARLRFERWPQRGVTRKACARAPRGRTRPDPLRPSLHSYERVRIPLGQAQCKTIRLQITIKLLAVCIQVHAFLAGTHKNFLERCRVPKAVLCLACLANRTVYMVAFRWSIKKIRWGGNSAGQETRTSNKKLNRARRRCRQKCPKVGKLGPFANWTSQAEHNQERISYGKVLQ